MSASSCSFSGWCIERIVQGRKEVHNLIKCLIFRSTCIKLGLLLLRNVAESSQPQFMLDLMLGKSGPTNAFQQLGFMTDSDSDLEVWKHGSSGTLSSSDVQYTEITTLNMTTQGSNRSRSLLYCLLLEYESTQKITDLELEDCRFPIFCDNILKNGPFVA